MADKKRDILEFVEQSNFEQLIPTRIFHLSLIFISQYCFSFFNLLNVPSFFLISCYRCFVGNLLSLSHFLCYCCSLLKSSLSFSFYFLNVLYLIFYLSLFLISFYHCSLRNLLPFFLLRFILLSFFL
jgi:hypothetical protein